MSKARNIREGHPEPPDQTTQRQLRTVSRMQVIVACLAIVSGCLAIVSGGIDNSVGVDPKLYAVLDGIVLVAAGATSLLAARLTLAGTPSPELAKRHGALSVATVACGVVAGVLVLGIMYDSGLAMFPPALVIIVGVTAIIRRNRMLSEL